MKESALLKKNLNLLFLLEVGYNKEAGMSLLHSITLDTKTSLFMKGSYLKISHLFIYCKY